MGFAATEPKWSQNFLSKVDLRNDAAPRQHVHHQLAEHHQTDVALGSRIVILKRYCRLSSPSPNENGIGESGHSNFLVLLSKKQYTRRCSAIGTANIREMSNVRVV